MQEPEGVEAGGEVTSTVVAVVDVSVTVVVLTKVDVVIDSDVVVDVDVTVSRALSPTK